MLTRAIDGWRRMSTYRKIRRVFMLSLLGVGIWALTPYLYTRQVEEAFPAQSAAVGVAVAQSEPRALVRGSFTRVDPVHAGEGIATIHQLPDGKRVLRFESFSVTNGPDLFVGLSGHPMPRNLIEVHDQGYLQLDALKGNSGSQNYDLPADLDLKQFKSVVIYCRAFSVVFSTAELQPAP